MSSRRVALTAALVAAGVGLSACGSADPAPTADATNAAGQGGKIAVVASFYPLAYAVQQVGGDKVEVTNLTKPGAEPHDLELTPQDVATVTEAKLAVYEKGFQPAVDKAIADQQVSAFDVATVADLSLRYTDAIGGSDHAEPAPGRPTRETMPATTTRRRPARPIRTSGSTRSATRRSRRPSPPSSGASTRSTRAPTTRTRRPSPRS